MLRRVRLFRIPILVRTGLRYVVKRLEGLHMHREGTLIRQQVGL
jgi:hypothetical protein